MSQTGLRRPAGSWLADPCVRLSERRTPGRGASWMQAGRFRFRVTAVASAATTRLLVWTKAIARGVQQKVGASYAAAVQALLEDGPLQGTTVEVEAVEGRPPKTVDVPDDKGGVCRYCLAEWTQEGMTAAYTFLYAV
jgi:hypothetical protein